MMIQGVGLEHSPNMKCPLESLYTIKKVKLNGSVCSKCIYHASTQERTHLEGPTHSNLHTRALSIIKTIYPLHEH